MRRWLSAPYLSISPLTHSKQQLTLFAAQLTGELLILLMIRVVDFIERRLSLVLLGAALLLGCQAVADQVKKVPVTTSSKAALKYFEQGRDLQEKIRFQDSRENLEKAVAADPDFALAHLYLSFSQPSAK